MNGIYKGFFNFLNYIGLITDITQESFNKSLNNVMNQKKEENDIYSNLTEILETYLNCLLKEDNISIAKAIVLKYKENRDNLIKNRLYKLIKNKEIKLLNICFEKYYKKIFPIKNEETNNNRTDIMSITHQNNSSVNRLNLSTIDLINRQEKYINKYNQNKIKNLKEKEKINLELCPFKPMIFTKNSSNEKKFLKNSERNPYKRLYDDLEKRQYKQIKLQKDNMLLIKQQSNFKSKNPLSPKLKEIKSKDRIEKLYNDYKERKDKNNILQKEIDVERGLTFNPFLYKKKPKSNRNKSFKVKTIE